MYVGLSGCLFLGLLNAGNCKKVISPIFEFFESQTFHDGRWKHYTRATRRKWFSCEFSDSSKDIVDLPTKACLRPIVNFDIEHVISYRDFTARTTPISSLPLSRNKCKTAGGSRYLDFADNDNFWNVMVVDDNNPKQRSNFVRDQREIFFVSRLLFAPPRITMCFKLDWRKRNRGIASGHTIIFTFRVYKRMRGRLYACVLSVAAIPMLTNGNVVQQDALIAFEVNLAADKRTDDDGVDFVSFHPQENVCRDVPTTNLLNGIGRAPSHVTLSRIHRGPRPFFLTIFTKISTRDYSAPTFAHEFIVSVTAWYCFFSQSIFRRLFIVFGRNATQKLRARNASRIIIRSAYARSLACSPVLWALNPEFMIYFYTCIKRVPKSACHDFAMTPTDLHHANAVHRYPHTLLACLRLHIILIKIYIRITCADCHIVIVSISSHCMRRAPWAKLSGIRLHRTHHIR